MKCALIGAAVLQGTAEHVSHDTFVLMADTHWEVASYIRCKGNTLWKGDVQKAEDCALKCIDDDHCLSFEYDHDKSQQGKAVPGGCTLKRQGSSKSRLLQVSCESEEPSHTNHFTIMLAARHNHSTHSNVVMKGGKRWTVTDDFDCYGGDLGPPKKITAGEDAEEECAAQCAAMPGCVGFADPHREDKTWNAAFGGERVCYMKGGATHVHIPSEGVLCHTGLFTPSWNYYSLMSAETRPVSSAAFAAVDRGDGDNVGSEYDLLYKCSFSLITLGLGTMLYLFGKGRSNAGAKTAGMFMLFFWSANWHEHLHEVLPLECRC